jgi:hypothetical protein
MPDRLLVLPGDEIEPVALFEPSEPKNCPYALDLLRDE